MTNHLHQKDIPAEITFQGDLAIDTETMGLRNGRDRLCVIQLSDGQGEAHLVQFASDSYQAPNLRKILTDPDRTHIYHFARFDMAILKTYLDIEHHKNYCTKIASKLARTYTDHHGLKDLCKELLDVTISKQQQASDWGSAELTTKQIEYAASDVLYLHQLRSKLNIMLEREGRMELAQAATKFLTTRVALDLAGWQDLDIFAH